MSLLCRLVLNASVLLVPIAAMAQPLQPPRSPHHEALEAHRDAPTHPSLIADEGQPIRPLRQGLRSAAPCATIFGYLPYWESSDNIRWDHITHIAAFSVEVNGDGTLGNDHGWPWTSLVNEAHANGVKVVLAATLFNPGEAYSLVTTPAYKQAFFTNIKNKMLEGTADGINIDFEGSGSYLEHINQFMAELTEYMHAEVPGCEVTFAGPAINYGSWDLAGLAASCDGIFIMGYAFAGSWSSQSGANAPLTGGTLNITASVLNHYAPVTQATPEKLILGVPYYGHHWTTMSSSARSTVVAFQGSTRFYNDVLLADIYGRQWEVFSQTPWYYWYQGGQWHQTWYDDAESLGLKYQLAQDHNLQGVGMWALDYDGSRPELWDELGDRFVDPCCPDPPTAAPVVAFQDDFDAGASAANWALFASSADYTAEFAYDYSDRGIPPAPHSAGTTIGLKFTANNNDQVPDAAAVNVYPIGQHFAGAYRLSFDMWINYNGGPGGDTGATEFMLAGLNAAGGRVNWPLNPASDGYTFAVDGEGDSNKDYRVYYGINEYAAASNVYAAGSQDHTASAYQITFRAPPFETQGVPGKQWVEVSLAQADGEIRWRINGVTLATIPAPAVTAGNVMIGYMDLFDSLAVPAEDNFIIFDNVRVEYLPDPDCNANGTPDACETIAPGDFDADGVTGPADIAAFAECLNGPFAPPLPLSPTCGDACLTAFDFDGDNDIDLADFAAFCGL